MVMGMATENSEHALFDLESYELYRTPAEIPPTVSRDMLLTFPKIRQVDIQRAYVESLNDRNIKNRFRNMSDEEFWHYFWRLFDDDGIWSSDYMKFEEKFYLKAIIDWCDSNGVFYRCSTR